MSTEHVVSVTAALQITRKFRGLAQSHRRIRIHKSALEKNAANARALDGECGKCKYLTAYSRYADGKNVVQLVCSKGHAPELLYIDLPPGEQANCDDLDPKESLPQNGRGSRILTK